MRKGIMTLEKLIKNPALIVPKLGSRGFFHNMDDETYLKRCFKASMGYEPDFENPQTFNEKLQWLKLYDRDPLYTTLVDKYAVKEWVAERIGEEHIIPTLGVWNKFDEIDFDALPSQFVLKCTHDSGGLVISRDKSKLNKASVRKKFEKLLRREFYYVYREWPYKNVKPRIIAEQYLETKGDLADYKVFAFSNGRLIILVCEDRFAKQERIKTFFDEMWHPLPITEGGHPSNPAHTSPAHFEEMKSLTRILADGMSFVRVDWYEVENRLYFGEMTFYPNAGYERFDPRDVDHKWGSWIDLPK
jgi:hypothetical protein